MHLEGYVLSSELQNKLVLVNVQSYNVVIFLLTLVLLDTYPPTTDNI